MDWGESVKKPSGEVFCPSTSPVELPEVLHSVGEPGPDVVDNIKFSSVVVRGL